MNHYLTSPVWRFAIAPGVLGPEGLGGVMMPSVDRVGRYFPLIIGAVGAPPLLDWFPMHAAVALQGHSLWGTDGAPGVEPSMLMCAGLPRAERFTAMLDAR